MQSLQSSLPAIARGTRQHEGSPEIRIVSDCAIRRASWEALATSIEVWASVRSAWEKEQSVELLWSGPLPADRVPARRIDQVLYDLISGAETDILLVTFAACKIKLLRL